MWEKCGLKINPNKTKTVRISNKRKENLTFNERTIDEVEAFVHVTCVVTEDGVTEQDKKNCINKAYSPFIHVFTIWKSKQLSL
jgi:hypothetical protein